MTENTTTTETTVTPAPKAKGPAGPVLMSRSPKAGGKGVTKMLVPADQIEDFKAAGWTAEA